MTKDKMLNNIRLARKLMDEVYYHVRYITRTTEKYNKHLIEIESLMSHADTCAMNAIPQIKSYFKEHVDDPASTAHT